MERFRSRLRYRTREKLRGRLLGRDTSPIPDPALVGLYQQDASQISGQSLVGFYREASPLPGPPMVGPMPDESMYGLFRNVSPMQVGLYPEQMALHDPTMYGFYPQDPRYYGFYRELSPLRDQLYQPQISEGSPYTSFLQETAPASESMLSRFYHGGTVELTRPDSPRETVHLQDAASETTHPASSRPATSVDRFSPSASKITPEQQQKTPPNKTPALRTGVDLERSLTPREAPRAEDQRQASSLPRTTVDVSSPYSSKGPPEDAHKPPQPSQAPRTPAHSTGVELARPLTLHQTPQFRDPDSETLHQASSMPRVKADRNINSPASKSTPKDGQKPQPPGVDSVKPYSPHEASQFQDPMSENLCQASSIPRTMVDISSPYASKCSREDVPKPTQAARTPADSSGVELAKPFSPRAAPQFQDPMSENLRQASSITRTMVDISSPYTSKSTREDVQKPTQAPRTPADSSGVELARPFSPRAAPQFQDPMSENLRQASSIPRTMVDISSPYTSKSTREDVQKPTQAPRTPADSSGVELARPFPPRAAPQYPSSETLRQPPSMPAPREAPQFRDPRSETPQQSSSMPRTNLNTSSPSARKSTPEDGQRPQLTQAPRTPENTYAKPRSLSQAEGEYPSIQSHNIAAVPVPIGLKRQGTFPRDRDTEPSDRNSAELPPRDGSQPAGLMGTQASAQETPCAVIMQANKPQRMPSPFKQLANKLQDLKQATFARRPPSFSEISDALTATQKSGAQRTLQDPDVAKVQRQPDSRERELPDVTDIREADSDKNKPKGDKDRTSPKLPNRASPKPSPKLGIRRNSGRMSPMMSKRFSPRLERAAAKSSPKLLDDPENPKNKNYLRAMVMIQVRRRTGNESSTEKLKRLRDGTLDDLKYSPDASPSSVDAASAALPLPAPPQAEHEDEGRAAVAVPGEQRATQRGHPEVSTQEQEERGRAGSTAAMQREAPVDATYAHQRGSAWSGSRRQDSLSQDKPDVTGIPRQSREDPRPEKTGYLQSAGDSPRPSRSMDRFEPPSRTDDVTKASRRSLEDPRPEKPGYLQSAGDAQRPSRSMDRNEPPSRTDDATTASRRSLEEPRPEKTSYLQPAADSQRPSRPMDRIEPPPRTEPWPEKTRYLQSAGDAQGPSRSMDRDTPPTRTGDVTPALRRSLEQPRPETTSYLQPVADAQRPSRSMDRNEPSPRTGEPGSVRTAAPSGLVTLSESDSGYDDWRSPRVLSPDEVPAPDEVPTRGEPGPTRGASADAAITDTKAMPRDKQQIEPRWKNTEPESKDNIKYEPSRKRDQSEKDMTYSYAVPTRAYESPAQKHQPVTSNEQKALRERWEDNEKRSLMPQAAAEPPQMPYYDTKGERDARPAEYKPRRVEAVIQPPRQQPQQQPQQQQAQQAQQPQTHRPQQQPLQQPQQARQPQQQQEPMSQHGSLYAEQTQRGGDDPLEMKYEPRSGGQRADDPRRGGGLPSLQGAAEQEPQLRPYSPRPSDKRDRVPDMSVHLQSVRPKTSHRETVESDIRMEHPGRLPSTIIIGPVKYKRGSLYASDGSDSDSGSKEYYFTKGDAESSLIGPYRLSEGGHPEGPGYRSRDSPVAVHAGGHGEGHPMLTAAALRHPASSAQSEAPTGSSGVCASGHDCEGASAPTEVSTSPILLARPLPHVPQTTIVNVIIKRPNRSRNKQGRHKDDQEGRSKLRRPLGNSASSKSASSATQRHLGAGFGSKTSLSASTQTYPESNTYGTRSLSSDNEEYIDEKLGVSIATQTIPGVSRRRMGGEALLDKSVVQQARFSEVDERNRKKQTLPQSFGRQACQWYTKENSGHGGDDRRENTDSHDDEEPYLSADDFLSHGSEIECWEQSEAERLMWKEGILLTQGSDEQTTRTVQMSAKKAPHGREYSRHGAKEQPKMTHEHGVPSKIFESGAAKTSAQRAQGYAERQRGARQHAERGQRQQETGASLEPQSWLSPRLAAQVERDQRDRLSASQEDRAEVQFTESKAGRVREDAQMETAAAIKEAESKRPDCIYMQYQSQPTQLSNVAPRIRSVISDEAAQIGKAFKSGELKSYVSRIDLDAADNLLPKTPSSEMFKRQKYVSSMAESEFRKDPEDLIVQRRLYTLDTDQRDSDALKGCAMSGKTVEVELQEDMRRQSRDLKPEVVLETDDDVQRFEYLTNWEIQRGPCPVMDIKNVNSVEESEVYAESRLVAQALHFPDEEESVRLWKVVGCLEELVLTLDRHILSLSQRPVEGATVGPLPGLVEVSGEDNELGELIVEEEEKCSEIKSYLENLSKMIKSNLKAIQQNAESMTSSMVSSMGLPLAQLGTELIEHYTHSIAKLLESYLQAQAALMTASRNSVAQRLECECLQRSYDQALARLQQIKVEVIGIEKEIDTTKERGNGIRDRLDAAQAEAQRMSSEIMEISGELRESAKECEALETDLHAVTQKSSDGVLKGPGWDRDLLEKRITLLNDMLSSHQKKIRDLVAQMDGMRSKLGEEKTTNHQLTTEISQLKYEIHEMKFLVEFLESERELEKSKLAAGSDSRGGESEDATLVVPPLREVASTPPPSAVPRPPSQPSLTLTEQPIAELSVELDVSAAREQALKVDSDALSSDKSVQTDHTEPVLVICKEELDWDVSPLDFLFDHCERESDLLMERIQRLDSFVRVHMAGNR